MNVLQTRREGIFLETASDPEITERVRQRLRGVFGSDLKLTQTRYSDRTGTARTLQKQKQNKADNK